MSRLLFESLTLVDALLWLALACIIVVAPVGCWSCVARLLRVEREVLTELKIPNSHLRNKGLNMD